MAASNRLVRPPGPRGLGWVGSLWAQLINPLDASLRGFQEYGDIVHFHLGRNQLYLVSHPRYVRHFLADNAANYTRDMGQRAGDNPGLFDLYGDTWKRHRRLMQPGFHRERVKALVPRLVDSTRRLLDSRWEELARKGEPFDMTEEVSRLTVTHMAQAVYSEDVSDEAFAATREMLRPGGGSRSLPVALLMRVLPFLDSRRQKRREARGVLDEVSRVHVEQRRGQGQEGRQDMLEAMMEARDEKGEGLSDAELRAEFFTLFFAGHEAATSALLWSWYLLDQNPEVAERLRGEVERVLGDRPPTLEDLPALSYATHIMEEAMRLYPPAPVLTRRALEADRMGDYDVPAGTLISAMPYILHRHPDLWEQPERFDPERFAEPRVQKLPKFLYIPFGAGQRLCLGNNVALLQGTLVLAMVAQRYRVSLVPGRPVVPKLGPTFHPAGGLQVSIAPARVRSLPVQPQQVA